MISAKADAMKRIALGNLVASASNVAMFADKMARATARLGDRDATQLDSQDLLRTYVMSLTHISDTATWLDLPATIAAAVRCKSAFDRLRATNGVIDKKIANDLITNSHQLYVALSDELEKHHAYVVAPKEGELIDSGISLFGLDVVNAYPAIRRDVSEGARCRAYELWTASVMHMMRIAEVGVGALADHLGTSRGPSWGVTINNVQQALDQQRKSQADPNLKQWASEIATYLNFVKDAFRNPAMHPEMSFDREQAVSVYDNTRAFMRKLNRHIGSQT
jgi:hypothetical protein